MLGLKLNHVSKKWPPGVLAFNTHILRMNGIKQLLFGELNYIKGIRNGKHIFCWRGCSWIAFHRAYNLRFAILAVASTFGSESLIHWGNFCLNQYVWYPLSFSSWLPYIYVFYLFLYIRMAYCKTTVTPFVTHWGYCSLALSHRYSAVISAFRSFNSWFTGIIK